MYEIKTEGVYEDFSSNKEMFDFSNYLTKSKYYDDSTKLVLGKMKYETGWFLIEELKAKMYSVLVDNNREQKKAKSVNKNVVETINHKWPKRTHNRPCNSRSCRRNTKQF